MAREISADWSEAEAFSVDIGRASAAAIAEVRPVLKKALQNVKRETAAAIPDRYWDRLAQTLSYDVVGLSGEVGYEDRGQGELAGIYEFGSARRAPHPTLYPAAERESERFERYAADALEKAIEGKL